MKRMRQPDIACMIVYNTKEFIETDTFGSEEYEKCLEQGLQQALKLIK